MCFGEASRTVNVEGNPPSHELFFLPGDVPLNGCALQNTRMCFSRDMLLSKCDLQVIRMRPSRDVPLERPGMFEWMCFGGYLDEPFKGCAFK